MNIIDKAILKYLEDFNPELLDSLLTSPNLIIESMILADNHLLKDEAITILDSLNSYNNSINNVDNEDELLNISETSPLYSWRCGVLAIKEFYNENHIKVTEYLNEIRDISPVKKLTLFLTKGRENSLFNQDKNLIDSVDTLKEVIDNSMIDLYPNCVKLLLADLKIEDEQDKEDLLLTIIEESSDNIPLDIIHKSIINYITVTESTRLMALGTMFKYPIKALQYLFSYFSLKNFTNKDDINFNALRLIILDLVKALIKEKYKFNTVNEMEDFKNSCDIFINRFSDFYPLDYKTSDNPLTNLRRALDIKTNIKLVETNIEKEIQGTLF